MLQIGQPVEIGSNWAKYNGGYYGDEGRIEAVGYDWVVIRLENGKLSMGSIDPSHDPHQQLEVIRS